jgi:hypothetical protein
MAQRSPDPCRVWFCGDSHCLFGATGHRIASPENETEAGDISHNLRLHGSFLLHLTVTGKIERTATLARVYTESRCAKAGLTAPGRRSDGGLYLSISPAGAGFWVIMWKVAGKRREMGLGSLRDVSLAKARQRAAEARQKLVDGIDPLATKETAHPMTFGEAADALLEIMSSWRNDKHRAHWKMTLT